MALYRVKWEIDIDADTPTEAAVMAMIMQQYGASTALVYEVWLSPAETDALPEPVTVDLMQHFDEMDGEGG